MDQGLTMTDHTPFEELELGDKVKLVSGYLPSAIGIIGTIIELGDYKAKIEITWQGELQTTSFIPQHHQVKKVEEKGVDKSPKVAVILDDIQSSPAFMRSNPFTQLFIAGRHYSISVFVCCQQFKRLPKVCRLQASNIFFFPSSLTEVETLSDEFCPPNMSKKDFKEMIKYATNEPYQFLHINMFCHFKDRYRKNLDEVLELVD